MSNLEPTPPGPPSRASVSGTDRPRLNRRWVVLVIASFVVLGIGIGVMLIATNSRSDAESDRDTKNEQLVSQRSATREAEQEARLRRAQAAEVADAADVVLNLAAQIYQIDDQVMSANQDAVDSFSNPDPSTFNAATDRSSALIDQANALIDQVNAAIDVMNAKIDALGQGGTHAS
jgi:hypothetical protein